VDGIDWPGKAADVGIGISGEEGLQAVNSSDYAIAQVRFTLVSILLFVQINNLCFVVPFLEETAPGPRALVLCTQRNNVRRMVIQWLEYGVYSLNRILNFFYKNILITGVLWWFQIYDGWSAT
jgi:phospholipid-translocating ATPase